jgi:hypothetical protein
VRGSTAFSTVLPFTLRLMSFFDMYLSPDSSAGAA